MNYIQIVAYLYSLIKEEIHYFMVEGNDGKRVPYIFSENRYVADAKYYGLAKFVYNFVEKFLDSSGIRMIDADILVKILYTATGMQQLVNVLTKKYKTEIEIVSINLFDAEPYLINCQNGLLDLLHGTIRKTTPKDLVMKISASNFLGKDSNRSKLFNDLLFDMLYLDGATRTYTLERVNSFKLILATFLTGDVSLKVAYMIIGTAHTGKSLLLRFLQKLLFLYGAAVSSNTFMDKKYSDPDLIPGIVRNQICRLISASEFTPKAVLNSTLFKNITGNDIPGLRDLHKSSDPKPFFAKILLVANNFVRLSLIDKAMIDRIVCINFDNPIPKEKQDRELKNKLENQKVMDEVFTELALLVPETKNVSSDEIIHESFKYTAHMHIMQQKNSIAPFWNEVVYLLNPSVQRHERALVASKDIYDFYTRFCDHYGYKKVGKDKFYKSFKMLAKDVGIEISNSHDRPAGYYGIGLCFNGLEVQGVLPTYHHMGFFQLYIDKDNIEE